MRPFYLWGDTMGQWVPLQCGMMLTHISRTLLCRVMFNGSVRALPHRMMMLSGMALGCL